MLTIPITVEASLIGSFLTGMTKDIKTPNTDLPEINSWDLITVKEQLKRMRAQRTMSWRIQSSVCVTSNF